MPQPRQRSWSRCAAAFAMSLGLAGAGCSDGGTESLLKQARQYRQDGEIRAAVIELKNALQAQPDHPAARALLGEVYIEQGDAVSAEKELRRALALGVPGAAITPLLAKAMLMQGQYRRMLGEIAPAADVSHRSEILALRGQALLGLDQPGPASESFNEALKLDPLSSPALLGLARVALARHQPHEADELLARALAANPDDIDCLRFQGDLLRLQGKSEAALASYRKILALKPHHAQAHIDIANLLTDGGRFKEARAELEAARKISAATVGVFYAQALLDFREGKQAAARESLQQIVRVAPDHLPSILLLAAVEEALGANQQAEQHLQTFLAAYPGHLYATKLMATLYLRTNRHDAASELLGPLMARNGDDIQLLTLAGEANMRARNFSRAAGYFEKASALSPDAAVLHTALALSRLGSGENSRAVAELELAASLDIKTPRAGVLLVMNYLRANMPDKALATVAQMEAQGNNPLIQNLKGAIHLARQDIRLARACFEKALALDPLYMPALDNLANLDRMERRPGDASRRYQAALGKAPDKLALMEALARLAAVQGKTAEAIGWLERASGENPDALGPALRLADFYARAGENQKALALAQKLRAGNPASADALELLAHVYYLNHRFAAAADTYAMLAALAPGSAAPYMKLASARLAERDQPGALAAFRKALSIEPDLLEANLGMLTLLTGLKKFPEAIALALTLQHRHPRSPAGYQLEGDVLSAQDQQVPALKAYERAFALENSGPLLIRVHAALARSGKAAEAQRRMLQWLKDHPDDVPTRLYFASSKLVGNDARGATLQLKAVLERDPQNVMALNDLAWASARLHDGDALAYAERAYRLAPDNASVIDTLGWFVLENGDVARALALLKKASSLAPDASELRYHFGVALARSGDRPAARRELERALASPLAFAQRAEAAALLATL